MKYNEIENSAELIDFMDKNIKYGFMSIEGKIYDNQDLEEWQNAWYSKCIVQDGKNVLNSGYATCWDQVELERKWFLEHNYKVKTIFMCYETEKALPSHTFLIYQENNQYYWFEHAFEECKGIYE